MSSDSRQRSPADPEARARAPVWQRLLAILLGNGVLGLFVVTGRIEPLYLVLLMAIEALCLTLVEAVEVRLVPARDVEPELRRRLVKRFFFIGVCMAGLLFFNGLILFAMFDGQVVRAFLRTPLAALAASNIGWPLAVTLALALVDAGRDLRRHGVFTSGASKRAAFATTPGKSAQARWLTLVLSALPHAIPLFSVVALATRYVQRHNARARGAQPPPVPRAAIAALLALVAAVLLFVSWMLSSGVQGWTVAFCIGKIFSEGLIFALPVVSSGADSPGTPSLERHAARPDARSAPPASVVTVGKPSRRARRRLRGAP